MKMKALILFLILNILLCPCAISAFGSTPDPEVLPDALIRQRDAALSVPLVLPETPDTPSDELAFQLLCLNTAMNEQETEELLDSAGFTVTLQNHYDKEPEDASHTCAFTIASGDVLCQEKETPALLVVIRGTLEVGEWYSNFDLCPSHLDPPEYAENFLFCAEDVLLSLQENLEGLPDDMPIIVTGFSRGAACANLLGVLLHECAPERSVYVYTFACPNTIGKDSVLCKQDHIFNYINPSDLIPMLPLPEWGFARAGNDIVLPLQKTAFADAAAEMAQAILTTSPTITDYYTARHSLIRSGEDPTGLTPFELMILLAGNIAKQENILVAEDGRIEWNPPDPALTVIPESVKESDYYLLLQTMEQVFGGDLEQGIEQLSQHFPSCYMELFAIRQEESHVLH